MIKKILICAFLLIIATGCSRCLLVRSEYYDITGSVLTPKTDDAVIEIFETGQEAKKPYVEIGAIKVMAQYGISKEALNREIIKRAKAAGADAVINVQYIEDKENKFPLCGKLLSTKRNMTAIGKAVIFSIKNE